MATKDKRYEKNPFIEDMLIPVRGKNIQISTLGKDDNILVNQKTGEVSGTHVVARKKVDSTKFIKTFVDYMSFTFDLTRAGNKALRVVMWAIQEQSIGKDIVNLDKYTLSEFLKFFGMSEVEKCAPNLSYPTFARGLGELCKAKIIAKTVRQGVYFINPNCMFNGDRIAFTTLIERDEEVEIDKNHLKLD